MNWRIPLVILSVVLVLSAVVTLGIYGRPSIETISTPIGIHFSTSAKARIIDREIAKLQERNGITDELKARLQHPPRVVDINGFYLDTCEVSQLRYEQYLDFELRNFTDEEKAQSPLWSLSTGHRVAGRLDSAASGISFPAAQRYCQAAGGRLPFAEEYEIAASGIEGRLYPWGDEFTDYPWPYKDAGRNAAQVCGSQSTSITPNGIYDLASNVLEWGQGYIQATSAEEAVSAHGAPPLRAQGRELYALNAAWLLVEPDIKSHHLGFRCAYDEPPRIQIWSFAVPEATYVPGGSFVVGFPADARLPRFVANVPNLNDISIGNLLVDMDRDPKLLEAAECEVTRASYQSFLADPLVKLGLFGNDNQPADMSYLPLDWETQQQNLHLPVTGVNWWSADAFARWVGGRLPTNDEWRQLAAGQEATSFPWGNSFEVARTNELQTTLEACGTRAFDTTPTGIHDLAGNVSEWTKSVTAERGRLSIWVQGGNWRMFTPETAGSTFGRIVPLNHRSESIGFRVVFD